MECDEEMYPAVRPKQQMRRPTRLQDFEVDYEGYNKRNQTQSGPPTLTTERVVSPAWEGLESITPFHGEEDWSDPKAWPEPEENLDKGICNLKLDKQALSDSKVCSPPDDSVSLPWRLATVIQQYYFIEARLIADVYLNSPAPYTDTLTALHDKFGQPHQLALQKMAAVLEAPEFKCGDIGAFQRFSLQIQSLVGLLQTLGPKGEIELNCGSHVAQRLSKLPAEQRAEFHWQQSKQPGATHNLYNLSEWLRYESWCQSFDSPAIGRSSKERQNPKIDSRPGRQTVTVLHGAGEPS
ncbi:hypothetical protein SRHO_G00228650 [Serrasalmus rhombeus]